MNDEKDLKYWTQQQDRYLMARRSLERQIVELDAFSPDWEECCAAREEVLAKLVEIGRRITKARQGEMNRDQAR